MLEEDDDARQREACKPMSAIANIVADQSAWAVCYRRNVTGIPNTIFIATKIAGGTPRIKIAIDPPDTLDPRIAIPIALDGDDHFELSDPQLLAQVVRFMQRNRTTLLDYWEFIIDTEELRQQLKPI
jgi:hypothetical protein